MNDKVYHHVTSQEWHATRAAYNKMRDNDPPPRQFPAWSELSPETQAKMVKKYVTEGTL